MARRKVVQTSMWPEPPRRIGGGGISDADLRDPRGELEVMISNDDFAAARPIHLVVLYLKLHERVYGVDAIDCGPGERVAAVARAKSMVGESFDNSVPAAVEFLRWTWTRENEREKFRRGRGSGGQRIAWRLQFSNTLIVDYRLHLARSKSSGPG